MRNKILIILIFLFALTSNAKSQTFDEILKQIESNNKEIQAAQKLLESKTYEFKNQVLPDGPEFSYGYFPNNSSTPGPKETFEISQSFQMPCFYKNQSALTKLWTEQEQISFQQTKLTVLSEAKKLLIESIYLGKMNLLVQNRLTDAENLMNAFTKRLETGDANILEVNKSKLFLLQVQNKQKTLFNELKALEKQLVYLNGGQELGFNITEYPLVEIVNVDSIIAERKNADPELLFALKQAESSGKMVKVTKNMQLPKFSLGYAGETVADEKFRGFVVGMSIPLWGSNSAIKKAKYEAAYSDLNNQFIQNKISTETQVQIERVQTLKENMENYESVLNNVNNTELLKKSLELGKISVIDYFLEISYYYQIFDDYMQLEKDYNLAFAELMRFKL